VASLSQASSNSCRVTLIESPGAGTLVQLYADDVEVELGKTIAYVAETAEELASVDVAEKEIVSDLALAAEMARKLAPLKVKLAIDHFGRSHSTLARLKELPFAELKLDRTFVTDCGIDKVKGPLCRTLIDLAHRFGTVAVAVGIEKASDALALTSMGCDMGQGFLLGQPMPEDRFLSLLRHRGAGQGRPAAAATR